MVATRLRFSRSGGENAVYYIDLARELSRHHRKLHRQKMIYTVYGGYMVDNPGPSPAAGRIDFNVAPDNWVTKRSINRGFSMWRKQLAIALQNAPGVQKQKYSDFKILLDLNMSSSGTNVLDTVDGKGQSLFNGGEWSYSLLTTQDPSETAGVLDPADQFNLQICGNAHSGADPNWTRISLIKSWVDSRPIPQQGSTAPDYTAGHLGDPLQNLFDSSDTNDDVISRYEDENDVPPYDLDEPYGMLHTAGTGSNLQRVATGITTEGAGAICQIPGFRAINGLIQVDWQSTTASEIVLDVESQGEMF